MCIRDRLYTKCKQSYAAGKEYVSKKSKHVMARKIKPARFCRMQCSSKISEKDRLEIFNSYWDGKNPMTYKGNLSVHA